ncbi:hypothetical protein [Palaeococcus ferrophilus]|uniref:hypothetical protein n=1 Tax=Palaeococcus ferrophilus TaxID=83868 RepID=UPI000696E1C4|nr:hypothetical protein [Palaeococcus ferrophilus]
METEISTLFKEAYEALNNQDYESAKRKFDRIMELSRGRFPEAYFEACFKLGDVFFEENNYRGFFKCSMRALKHVYGTALYEQGVNRMKHVLYIIKHNEALPQLAENMDPLLVQMKERPDLYNFVLAVTMLAAGKREEAREIASAIGDKKLAAILEELFE